MSKMKKCKSCSKEIIADSKICPECGGKTAKPFYKKIWFWILVVIIIGAIGSGGSSDTTTEQGENTNTNQTETVDKDTATKEEPKEEVVEENVPTEYKSALKKAKIYSDTMHMSKAGIYDQLTSEYGEKFSPESAQYAIDNVKADWNGNALKKAKIYQETMAMSPSAIYDQLISEYGEKFTEEEAQYAVDNLE